MTACSTCNRNAKFRLDAYDTISFPTNGHNLTCHEHLASTVIALEEQLAGLDDNDALCVSVLDEPTAAQLTANGRQLSARSTVPDSLTARLGV